MSAVTDLGQAQGLAWARSAHSCFTSSPLAELQQWQGGAKAPTTPPKPVSLEATTGPGWKSSYGPGERLSLNGLTLTLIYSDGSKKSDSWPFNDQEWEANFHFDPDDGEEITVPTTLWCEWVQYDPYVYLVKQLELGYTGPVPVRLEATTGPGWKSSYGPGEKLSLEGLTLTLVYSDGSEKSDSWPFDSYYPFDGQHLDVWPDDGHEITGPTTIYCSWSQYNIYMSTQLEIGYNGKVKNYALNLNALQPAIKKIIRPNGGFYPEWNRPEIQLERLPAVNSKLYSGEVKEGLSLNDLFSLAAPRQIFIESRYDGAEKTVVVNAAEPNAKIKGVVEGHKINGYRYLYGNNSSTAHPVSGWLSITPPQR